MKIVTTVGLCKWLVVGRDTGRHIIHYKGLHGRLTVIVTSFFIIIIWVKFNKLVKARTGLMKLLQQTADQMVVDHDSEQPDTIPGTWDWHTKML